jgi:hypothetical protein
MGSICDSRKQVHSFNINDQIKYIMEEDEALKNIKRNNKNDIKELEKDMRVNQVKSMFFLLHLHLTKETCNLNDLGKEEYSRLMATSMKKVWDAYEDVKRNDYDIKTIEVFKKEILLITNKK